MKVSKIFEYLKIEATFLVSFLFNNLIGDFIADFTLKTIVFVAFTLATYMFIDMVYEKTPFKYKLDSRHIYSQNIKGKIFKK